MLYHAVMSLVSRKSTKVKSSNKRTVILTQKRIAYIIVGIVGVLLVTNVMIHQMYRNKTYPKTILNNQLIGSQNYTEIKSKTKQIVDPHSLPHTIRSSPTLLTTRYTFFSHTPYHTLYVHLPHSLPHAILSSPTLLTTRYTFISHTPYHMLYFLLPHLS